MTGRVKWFDDKKGFGFIIPDPEGGAAHSDCFVHHTAIEGQSGRRSLAEGQQVEFRVESSQRGPTAVNVRALGKLNVRAA